MRFNHAENSDKIRGISFSQDEYSMAGSKLDRDLSFNNLCATLGNVAAELIIQPHQAITPSGGGGTNNEQGWRDDKTKTTKETNLFIKPQNVEDNERRCSSCKSCEFAPKYQRTESVY